MTQALVTTINKSPQTRLAFCNQVIAYKGDIEASFLELGRRLMIVRDERLYADNWETFEEYLQELKNISEATASKLINIYRVFVVEYEIPVAKLITAGGWTMLAEPLALIKSKKDALHWLHLATTLTRSDLRKEILEAKTGVLQATCPHPAAEQIYLRFCPACGDKERVNELPKDLKKKPV